MTKDKAADLVRSIAEESDRTKDLPVPASAPMPTRPNKSVPVAVRLSPEDAAAVDELAARLQVPSSVLLRG